MTTPAVRTPHHVRRSWVDGAPAATGAALLVLAALPVDSGHAAVAVALVAVAWPWLGTRGRLVCVALALPVCLARVYVGAHVPLDVAGGAGLGLAIAEVVRLLLGRPA